MGHNASNTYLSIRFNNQFYDFTWKSANDIDNRPISLLLTMKGNFLFCPQKGIRVFGQLKFRKEGVEPRFLRFSLENIEEEE
jgi:hypothetical protein